ncbi:MAG: hypothetical protein C4518_05750 [Desulfobacteraceae bacterium]|nr:MAG: hypothetical protein C4518_05750 [Desulfobacteraceae bacterium]
MNLMKKPAAFLICMTWFSLATACLTFAASPATKEGTPLVVFQWSGDYPVERLGSLPEGQHNSPVGYIIDKKTFSGVWQIFKPGEEMPEVDFTTHLIVFVRNINFYNQISIIKCTLRESTAEVLTMETRSAKPIEDKVAMALALIPRNGVKFINAGEIRIPVSDEIKPERSSAKNPDNACYFIEKQAVCLNNGQFEVAAASDSASKIKTAIFGEPVFGDLDGNGSKDAVMFLTQSSGGSGTFYYVAAALNMHGSFSGTHAIFLGDRISPHTIAIQDRMIIINYTDRKVNEPMSTPSSIGISRYIALNGNQLVPSPHH